MRPLLTMLVVTLGLAAPAQAGAPDQVPPAGYTFALPAACAEDAARAQKPSRPGQAVYPVCDDQMAIYAKALAEAKAAGQLVLVTFGATWCPWCATLQKEIKGAEVLGRKDDQLDYGRTFHHIEIGLSMVDKGKNTPIPSGEAVLKVMLDKAPGVKIRAIPFMAVIDPAAPERVFARNTDDVAKADKSHDLARFRGLLVEAHAFLRGRGAGPAEPGWIRRKWQRWLNG